MTMIRNKGDVETHYGSDRPAVNVKVYRWELTETERAELEADFPGYLAWFDAHEDADELVNSAFEWAQEGEWEYVEEWAREVFDNPDVTVESDGRSGGWCVVTGLAPVDEWDAVTLAKWRKFEKLTTALAEGFIVQVHSLIACNPYQHAVELAERAQARQDEAQRASDASWADYLRLVGVAG